MNYRKSDEGIFNSVLRDTLKLFGIRYIKERIPDAIWNESVNYLAEDLLTTFSHLFSTTETILNSNFSRHSIVEPLVTTPNGGFVYEIRIRPNDRFYEKYSALSVPAPSNPDGFAACGISVNLTLLEGFKNNKLINPPKIVMSFEVWGASERSAFKRMFFDYRRLTELLINEEQFKFHVGACLPRLEKYRGRNIGKKLEL